MSYYGLQFNYVAKSVSRGGGFQNGGSSSFFPQFILDQNVVLVSLNYRLGVFGFLNAGIGSARGNQGLKDQVLGLKWVQNNIHAFGGDKNRVTIFGESAGSMSVSYLIASQMAKGLFQGAIMQSGVFNSPFTYAKLNGKQCAITVAQAVGCPTNDMTLMVQCLTNMNASALTPFDSLVNALSFSNSAVYCGPSIETFAKGAKYPHVFLDQDPWAMIQAGNYSKVPVIIGSNFNTEMYPNAAGFLATPANVNYLNYDWDPAIIEVLYAAHNPAWFSVSQGAKQQFLLNLPATSNSGLRLSRLLTDRLFTHPARVLAAELSKSVNVYLYNFTHLVPVNGVPSYPAHAYDLQYLFNLNANNGIAALPSELPLSLAWVQAWTTFASTGTPGQLWGGVNQPWSKNTMNSPCGALLYANIDTVPSMQPASAQAMSDCQFWTSLLLNEPGQNKTCPTFFSDIK